MTPAFWISPEGYIVHVDINHINTVIKYPAKFGYTKKRIESIYNKHNEKVGLEGQARRQIILALTRKGWIRLRKYPNRYWSVTLCELNDINKHFLRRWCEMISGKGLGCDKEDDVTMPLRIYAVNSEEVYDEFDIDGCIKGKLKPPKTLRTRLKFLTSPEGLP